jgi:hypothetical protein
VGDEDLLEVIGNSADVYVPRTAPGWGDAHVSVCSTNLQKHLRKMFAGVSAFTTADADPRTVRPSPPARLDWANGVTAGR